MSDANDDWARLCDLLDDDPEVAPAVLEADDDDRWTALIDGLDEAGALAYLDEGDSGVELADALPALPRVFRAGIDLDEVGDIEGGIDEAATRADELLARHGLRLVFLEDESDAYPLVAVPAENVSAILELTERLGCTARSFP